ncbi:MAG: molecular chaperone HtpG [Spirochaetia bacterium]|nr:molecular chaperone HtpG [Spirochaetia bacterium]MDD7270057.1 molecular chaperone HtpG [Treponema sp.]MDY4984552.1 molecular chaperone HtpG [Treponema sp.]
MAKYQFQTEVNQLLKLIIHSLYSNKDIFLREIISNGSDALDKLKYLTVSDDAYKGIKFEPRLDIMFDEKAGTLTVQDSGIGMNEEDLTNNLGTIARSGTKAFMEKLTSEAAKDSALIGQFGVGFYSAFMAAKKIDVYTRKAAGDGKIWHWSSDGTNAYDIDEVVADSEVAVKYGFNDASKTGSAIEMHLNDDSKEFASRWKIEELIKRYSDHIAFPIYLHYEQKKYDDKGAETGSESKVEQVNSASALWKRSKSELKAEDYNEFYKTFGHDGTDPLHYVHTHAEGTQEYTTLFFIPQNAPYDMYQADYKSGVKLYVKRVFITDDDRELLPAYLRFVRGIIDSEDLPLNVSREILQQNKILDNIRNSSVKKLLSEFKKMGEAADKAKLVEADKRSDDEKKAIEKWEKFVKAFNRPMKEGLYSDYANRDEIAEIVRFKSTDASGKDGNYTSFADYVQRMKPDQKSIFYISGSDEKNLRENPLLKAYVAKGFEVLVMDDDIDDIVITGYGKYKDFELKAVNRSGSDEDLGGDKEEAKKKEEEFKPVVEKIQKALGDKVKEVKLSKTLSGENPSCIVVDENDPSFQMIQMMKAMGQPGPELKPILEVNGDHPIVAKLKDSTDEALISNVAEVLFNQALLIAGVEIKEPAAFVKALNTLLS